jgi:hypothetical protein
MNIYIIRGFEYEQKQLNNLERVLRKYNDAGYFNVKFISKIVYDDKEALKWQALANKHDNSEITDDEYFKHIHHLKHIDGDDIEVSQTEFFNGIKKWRNTNKTTENINEDDFVVLLTGVKNMAKWLSATDDKNNCYIDINDWEYIIKEAKLTNVPDIIYLCILNSIFSNLFHSLINITYKNAKKHAHRVSLGCISDFTIDKLNYIQSLRSGNICEKCVEKYYKLNDNIFLFNNIEYIIKNISNDCRIIPDQIKINLNEQFLIINSNGIEYGTKNNSINLISIKQKKLIPIYLYLLKFKENTFNLSEIKKLKKDRKSKFIYKSYLFCKEIFKYFNYENENISSDEATKIFRLLFYSNPKLNSGEIVLFDNNDIPILKSLNNFQFSFDRLSGDRLRIEKIITDNHPIKTQLENFIPKIIERKKWRINLEYNKIKWDDSLNNVPLNWVPLKRFWEEWDNSF